MEWSKLPPGVHKVKKKQGKDEIDRVKQAEKKKRRLEKALAASAAICAELEKKKQKKKEELERLDEEGAAIAEAVALHVLLGEDSDEDSYNLMLQHNTGLNHWECRGRFDLFRDGPRAVIPHANTDWMWSGRGNSNWMFPSGPSGAEARRQYLEDRGLDTAAGVAAGLLAAQAISSLKIAEEAAPLDAYIFNQMLRG